MSCHLEDRYQKQVDELRMKCPDDFSENECHSLELMVDHHDTKLNYDVRKCNSGKVPPVLFEPSHGQKGTFHGNCIFIEDLEDGPVHPALQAVWNMAH